MPQDVNKAVCYVIHDGHLLVFTHDTVALTTTGVQVPAGTIESGETTEDAALRELREETGRSGLILRSLGIERYDVRPVRDEIAVRHFFQLSIEDADVTERWQAGESDPASGERTQAWTCWWLPLAHAHVLAAGLGAKIGAAVSDRR